jgi:hypothetical protein
MTAHDAPAFRRVFPNRGLFGEQGLFGAVSKGRKHTAGFAATEAAGGNGRPTCDLFFRQAMHDTPKSLPLYPYILKQL